MMCSFKVLISSLICLLVIAVVCGRAARGNVQEEESGVWRFYLEENGSRMLITTEDNGKLDDCYLSGDDYVIELALKVVSESEVLKVKKKKMNALVELCTYAKWSGKIGSSRPKLYNKMGNVSTMVIYPGTKWCGAGNVSDGYDDLGPERETDMCCREHDHCDDSIEKFSSKYGLENNGPFTKSHCTCDHKFYDCLRNVNTKSSNRVGNIFFNYIRMECFKNEYPIIRCSKYKGSIRPRCVAYDLDETQPPKWQWFDAKEYMAIGEEKKRIKGKTYNKKVMEHSLQPNSLKNNITTADFTDRSFNQVTFPSKYMMHGAIEPHKLPEELKPKIDSAALRKKFYQYGWPFSNYTRNS